VYHAPSSQVFQSSLGRSERYLSSHTGQNTNSVSDSVLDDLIY